MLRTYVMYDKNRVKLDAAETLARHLPEYIQRALGTTEQVDVAVLSYQPNDSFFTGPVGVMILAPNHECNDREVTQRQIAFEISKRSWIPSKLCFDSHVWLYLSGGTFDPCAITPRPKSAL
jgi:hypothetical protein